IFELIERTGIGAYLVMFFVIFLETGGVITGFLPVLLAGFLAATILGDAMNFHIGRYFGGKYGKGTRFQFISRENWESAKGFYARKGRRSFLISRFIPIVRALNPFVAGFTQTDYREILPYNIVGNTIWVSLYVIAGFSFGNMEALQDQFHLLMSVVFIISFIPATIFLIHKRMKKDTGNKDKDA
ncbi:MAG TPA: VTT domain-containing protein, partial [Clostridiaceae bacterium]|nr:VTT domain-containing protein [Clostridiaceae bacterium]